MSILRLFSPAADDQLSPEKLGLKRHQTLVKKLMDRKGTRCAVSGIEAPISQNLPDGGMRVETIDPQKPVGRLSNLRLVDPMVYWCRHVNRAIEQGKGRLIFAPWFDQTDLLVTTRTAMLAAHFAKRANSSFHTDASSKVMDTLKALGTDELMLEALGLNGFVTEWNPKQWLTSLGQAPIRERRAYVKALARHIRFLPDEQAFQQWIAHLSDSLYLKNRTPQQWLQEATRKAESAS